MLSVAVHAGAGYDICIGRGALGEVGRLAAACKPPCRVLLVCDDTVAPLYAEQAAGALCAAGYTVQRFVFPAGEAAKNMGTLTQLLNAMGAAGLTRSDLVAALGGGVTGDLAGFAAAVYQRGIDFIQLPTTLLAAVDASVGGKTAVDLDCGKNMAGCFWQPRLVVCDIAAFDTLPAAVFAQGMAEVIKYGVILDEELFTHLEAEGPRRAAAGQETVARCCRLKAALVERDERDTGCRALLNFGHTVGHAVEACSGFAVPHGSGVAIGMVVMAAAAQHFGCAPAGLAARIAALCARWGLPTHTDIPPQELAAAARADKKRGGEGITVVVPQALGAAVTRRLSLPEMEEWFAVGCAAAAAL